MAVTSTDTATGATAKTQRAPTLARRNVPPRVTIGDFKTYSNAHDFVEELYEAGLDVTEVHIIADELVFEGRLPGRLNMFPIMFRRTRIALIIGSLLGLGFGLTGFFSPLASPLALAFYRVVFGGVVGMTVAILDYVYNTRNRAFMSKDGVYSDHYTVLVNANREQEALAVAKEHESSMLEPIL